MKKLIIPSLLLLLLSFFSQSCSKTKTYAEMLKEEKDAVEDFISRENIKVISVQEFLTDTITDVSKNEYVLFSDIGVYMQIENRGEGRKAENNDEIITKFKQYPLKEGYTDSISNIGAVNTSAGPVFFHDIFRYTVSSSGNMSATFLEDFNGVHGLLHYYYIDTYYASTGVPTGWLLPLSYIKLGRNTADLARVKLIIPSKQGHYYAQYYVLPYYYEIAYQLSR